MRILLAIIGSLIIISGCSILNPSSPEQLTIKVNAASFTSPNKFSATVTIDNNLGRQVNILNVGCLQLGGSFMPWFILEISKGNQWATFGAPACVAIDAGFASLPNNSQLLCIEAMYTDSVPTGIYRLRFDIREADLATKLPEDKLLSNNLSITR